MSSKKKQSISQRIVRNVNKALDKKNQIRTSALLLIITLSIGFGAVVASEITVGTTVWEIEDNAYSMKVGTFQYTIGSPTTATVTEMTGTTIAVDPDRTGTTVAEDGPQPEIVGTISQIFHCDRDGMSTDPSQPVNEYDAQGLHWEQHYYQMDVLMRTRVSLTKETYDDAVWDPTPAQNNMEYVSVNAKYYVSINLNTGFTGQGLKSGWGGAKVVNVEKGTVEEQYQTEQLVLKDNPWAAQPTYSQGASLGVFKTTGTEEDKNYIVELSAVLDPGVKYTYGIFEVRTGIAHQIDVFVKYTLRYSILVTRPLVVEQRDVQTLTNPDDAISEHKAVPLFGINFGNPLVAILTLVAIVVGFFLLFYTIILVLRRVIMGPSGVTVKT